MIIEQKTIPKGWQIKQIKDLLDFERPDNYIVKSESYSPKNKIPVLTANKSFILGYTDEDFGVYKNIPAIIFDDFTADSKFVDFPFKVKSSAIKILKSKENVDLRFVFELMKFINFSVANHKRHYISQYQNLNVAVPPINEQKKIAEILSAVDGEIEKTDEIILQAEKLRKGLMQDIFKSKIKNQKSKLQFKKDKWDKVPLYKIAKIERGKFSHRPRNTPEFYGGNIPFIQTSDVVNSNGKVSFFRQTLNEKGLAISKLFKKGTIVITIAANIGDTGILQFDSCFPDSLIGIAPNKNIVDAVFLEYFLRTQKSYLNNIATQSAQKNINLEKLNPLCILLPSLSEQCKIAEILSSVDNKIIINKELKNKLIQLKKGLMQDLLGGKVRIM